MQWFWKLSIIDNSFSIKISQFILFIKIEMPQFWFYYFENSQESNVSKSWCQSPQNCKNGIFDFDILQNWFHVKSEPLENAEFFSLWVWNCIVWKFENFLPLRFYVKSIFGFPQVPKIFEALKWNIIFFVIFWGWNLPKTQI